MIKSAKINLYENIRAEVQSVLSNKNMTFDKVAIVSDKKTGRVVMKFFHVHLQGAANDGLDGMVTLINVKHELESRNIWDSRVTMNKGAERNLIIPVKLRS